MSITLYQYKSFGGLPNPSPFCMKLEMYLRLAGLAYKVVTLNGRAKSPTGKAPYIDIDGKLISDSGLIIDHLERTFGHRVDGRLTLAQRAESLAFQRLMEEHLYWVMVYGRWVDPDSKAESDAYIKALTGIPGLLFPPIAALLRRNVRQALHGHGLGRHSRETLFQMGIADVAALGHWLGTRPYGFGDSPTVVDICMASYIGNIVRQPWSNPLKVATAKYGNLIAHFERLLALTFPDLSQTVAA
jgi:glutathione S-transferase